MTTRRNFLRTSIAGSAVISLAGAVQQVLLGASRNASHKANSGDDKILVVVQLSGGNDGLNTIIPFGDDEYYKNRFTLATGKERVLKIDDHVGFHPVMTGFNDLLQKNQLAIVQGVGYPNPNRSHFESMDLWHTAHRISEAKIGWLGRTIDGESFVGETAGDRNDLPALHFGRGLQPLALKNEGRPAPSIRSIDNFRLDIMRDNRQREQLERLVAGARDAGNPLLGYIHDSTGVALETSARLEDLEVDRANTFGYPGSALGRDLRSVARLIGSGLTTRIYYTALDGFDTHSNQAAGHQSLLADLSNSVAAFMKEIEDQGNVERVALFSFSEFGRRVRENASAGTDHGTAGPVFVAGSAVKPGLLSDHPDLSDLEEGDMKFGIDYRSVYSGLLRDWLGVEPDGILGQPFEPLQIFK